MSKYRFPGLNAYSFEDAFIFKGRDEDAENLLRQISLNKTLVLHAESGIGKSSLIQAGLLPILEKSNEKFIPVVIKLTELQDNKSNKLLVEFVMAKIYESAARIVENTFTLLPSSEISLWILNKRCEKNGKRLLLIFDQFENLQAFNKKQVDNLKHELFDLLNLKIPLDIYSSIEKKLNDAGDKDQDLLSTEYEVLSLPSKAKCVFVVREDKLGTMSLLCDLFPDILKNDFIIEPLSQEDAFEAICEPAIAEGDFYSKPFTFENNQILVDLIAKIADDETQLVDPIQLQIIARDLERNVVIGKKKTVINEEDIPEVADIINKFYADCWDIVANKLQLEEKEIFEVKRKIAPKLIVNDRRDLVAEGRIPEGNSKAALDILKKEGLVREVISEGTFYQLSHDRLVEPNKKEILRIDERKRAEKAVALDTARIEEEKQKAIQKAEDQKRAFDLSQKTKQIEFERRRRRALIIFSITVVVLLASFFTVALYVSNQKQHELKEKRIFTISNSIRTENPTFSYLVAKQWANANHTSSAYNEFLSYFDTSMLAFQKAVYPYYSTVVKVEQQNDSTLVVVDRYNITTWNTLSKVIVKQQKLDKGYYVGQMKIGNHDYYLVRTKDSLQIRSLKGDIEKQFSVIYIDGDGKEKSARDENIAISKDGNYIAIEENIYNYNTKQFIGKLPKTYLNDHDQMATIFLQDGKHLAAGYWSGAKFIFRIDEKAKEKIRISAIYPPIENVNYVITTLVVDSKDQFLYAGNRDKTIEVWKIEGLSKIDSLNDSYLNSVQNNMAKIVPYKNYMGHNGDINSLAISPGDSLLLSGSDDNTAILWNTVSGKKRSVVKGRTSKVIQVGFLNNNEEMYTATADELLFLWSRNKASELYERNQLSKFSPFDYYSVGLAKNNDEFSVHIYDTTATAAYFASTFDYIISLPVTNLYPEDAEYRANLQLSLSEIDSMFMCLTRRKDFNSTISIDNRRLLYKYYNYLRFRSADLLLETEDESNKAKYERFAEEHIRSMPTLFLDTSDVKTALTNAADFNVIGNFWQDSVHDNSQTFFYYRLSLQILQSFFAKFPDNSEIHTQLVTTYGEFALRYLYAKMPDSAIALANEFKKLRNGNGLADLRIIQAYLLQNKYDEAIDLYERKKNFIVRPDQEISAAQSLKEWLLPRLAKFKERNLTTPALEKFITYLKIQPTPAKLQIE